MSNIREVTAETPDGSVRGTYSYLEYHSLDARVMSFNSKAFMLEVCGLSLDEIYDDKDDILSDADISNIPNVVFSTFLHVIDDVAKSCEYDEVRAELQKAADDLKVMVLAARKTIGHSKAKSFNGANALIGEFVVSLVGMLVDAVTITKSEHSFSDGDGSEGDFHTNHYVTVQFKQDGNTWEYKINNVEGVNDWDFNVDGHKKPRLSETGMNIHATLKTAADMIALKEALNFLNDHFEKKDPLAVKNSKLVAGVLGGDYKDYLGIVANWDMFVADIDLPAVMKSHGLDVEMVIREMFIVDNSEVKQIAKILKKTPLFC